MKVIGIDLAGSEKRPTGVCLMNEKLEVLVKTLFLDEEIVDYVNKLRPELVAIDAPLSIPKGRKTIDDRSGPHLRKCDEELLRMGIKFFPITLGPMRKLTKRGLMLKNKLKNFHVIEVYPGASQDILGIPRKSKGLDKLRNGLKKVGIKGIKGDENDHELDAITAAYTGLLYLEGKCVVLGDEEEGVLIVPNPLIFKREIF